MAVRRHTFAQAGIGLALLLAGLAGMVALLVVTNGESAAMQAWALRLGLAVSLLLSLIAQLMVLVGAWMLWRSRHRAP